MFRILAPPADLQPYVRFFWAARTTAAAAPERVAPDGCCELILHFGAPARRLIAGDDWRLQPRAFVFGQIERAIELDLRGEVDVFGVRFQPVGVAALWGLDASALGPSECALDDLFARGRRLDVESLCLGEAEGFDDFAARARRVTQWLRASARGAPKRDVRRAAAALAYMHGREADVGAAARAISVSRRSLERAFRTAVGLSPAAYSRLRRIEDCARALRREDAALTAIALAAGYADQSHFTREFREIVGESPGAYRRRLGLAPPTLA